VVITYEGIIGYRKMLKDVLVFWDIHSEEKIWIQNYWKFGKESMLRLAYVDLIDNSGYFPEDIYIFDESLKWSLVWTHEDNEGIRICVKVGDI
jgi:hypothetical protein